MRSTERVVELGSKFHSREGRLGTSRGGKGLIVYRILFGAFVFTSWLTGAIGGPHEPQVAHSAGT